MDKQTSIAEPLAAKIGAGASIGGGATAFIGGWTANDIAMVGGVIGVIVGVIAQGHGAWVRHCERKEQRLEHEKRMRLLDEELDKKYREKAVFNKEMGLGQ